MHRPQDNRRIEEGGGGKEEAAQVPRPRTRARPLRGGKEAPGALAGTAKEGGRRTEAQGPQLHPGPLRPAEVRQGIPQRRRLPWRYRRPCHRPQLRAIQYLILQLANLEHRKPDGTSVLPEAVGRRREGGGDKGGSDKNVADTGGGEAERSHRGDP